MVTPSFGVRSCLVFVCLLYFVFVAFVVVPVACFPSFIVCGFPRLLVSVGVSCLCVCDGVF